MSHNLRPLDIGKLDFEGNRKRRRKKLLLWSLPFVIIATISAIWLITPAVATSQASSANESGLYDTADSWLKMADVNKLFEHYKQPFNQAVVATHQKRFEEASNYFREAITLAPDAKKCFVRVQSVLSAELAGDYAVTNTDVQNAITYYTKALAEMSSHPDCFKDQEKLRLRISIKLAAVIVKLQKKSYTTDDPSKNNDKTDSDTLDDEQLKKLETVQKNGQIKKQEANSHENHSSEKGNQW